MPRTARAIQAGLIYHVINRGNGKIRLFHKDEDFAAFERVLAEGLARYPVELLTYCLMQNHWHLVLRPGTDDSLGRLMGWIGVTHVRRHHEHYKTRGGGHLYQGRFKSFPVQQDRHFLVLSRYVEANAVRAGVVKRADQWRWCGHCVRKNGHPQLKLASWPADRPRNWADLLNDPMDEREIESIRTSVNRAGRSESQHGSGGWQIAWDWALRCGILGGREKRARRREVLVISDVPIPFGTVVAFSIIAVSCPCAPAVFRASCVHGRSGGALNHD